MQKVLSSSLLLGGILSLAACAAEPDDGPMTWEEFRAAAYVEPDTGTFIIDGDVPILTDEGLADAYRSYADGFDDGDGVGSTSQPLTVSVVDGAWNVWPPGTTVTYCIPNKGFSATRKAALINALEGAGNAWSAAGNIHFQYLPAEDGRCNNRNNNVTFNVKSVCRGQYLASAFFPDYPRRSRELSVDCTSFGSIAPWTLEGVMRHELGHTIGFRHEHVRHPANVCPEGGSWEGLTAYDSSSVMHYPQCDGDQDGDLVLTASDRAGASIAYP